MQLVNRDILDIVCVGINCLCSRLNIKPQFLLESHFVVGGYRNATGKLKFVLIGDLKMYFYINSY